MNKDNGRSPLRGSGSQASPEAGKPSSPTVSIPNAEEAFRMGVDYAAAHLADYARRMAALYEEGPYDPSGWPETPEGAARHELLAFAGSIEECVQHESLSPLFCSLASAMSAGTAETPQAAQGQRPASATAEGRDAQTPPPESSS